jgi:hypothetical protein
MEKLDAGEMDDRDGILVARSKGFRVSGTLGILAMAAAHGLLSLAEAFDHQRPDAHSSPDGRLLRRRHNLQE